VESTGKAAVAEFVATFALIFIGAGAVIAVSLGLDLTGVALAHGLVLAIMVSITAHISGGLVNPAVAISLWVTGKMPSTKAVVCIVAELLGAIAGALLLKALIPGELFDVGNGGIPALGDGTAVGTGILIEATLTFPSTPRCPTGPMRDKSVRKIRGLFLATIWPGTRLSSYSSCPWTSGRRACSVQ